MLSLLLKPAVLTNVLGTLVSILVGAGLIPADVVSKSDLSSVVVGVLALVTIGNGIAHAKHHLQQQRSVEVQSDTPAPGKTGSDVSSSDIGPLDPGGA